MTLAIRPMTHDDLSAVARINAESVPEVGEADAAMLADLSAMSTLSLVAERHGVEVVGFCIVLPPGADYASPNYAYFEERYDDFAYLDRIAVDAAHRGNGVGAALHAGIEAGTTADLVALEINVVPPNEASMRFHERLGFVEVDRLETRPGKIVSLQIRRRSDGRSR